MLPAEKPSLSIILISLNAGRGVILLLEESMMKKEERKPKKCAKLGPLKLCGLSMVSWVK